MSSDHLYRQRRDARAATTTSHETLALPLRPFRRHDSGTSRPLAPQSLAASFPSSRKPSSQTPPTYKPAHTGNPAQSHNPEDRLQTALSLLARAAAALLQTHPQPAGPTKTAVESLYRFASPTWSPERWSAAVEIEGARSKKDESTSEGGETAGGWVQRAVGLLQRDGELGAYWKDGRDLGEIWEKVYGELGWE